MTLLELATLQAASLATLQAASLAMQVCFLSILCNRFKRNF